MASSRAVIDLTGTSSENHPTLNTDGSLVFAADAAGGHALAGKAVTLVANAQAGAGGDGAGVLGELLHVQRDGKATVKTSGVCVFPRGAGQAPVLLGRVVCAAAAGSVRGVATGTAAEMLVGRGSVLAFDGSFVTVDLGAA